MNSVLAREVDFHQNEGRRKRQRMSPPEHPAEDFESTNGNDWADQLRAAANSDTSPQATMSSEENDKIGTIHDCRDSGNFNTKVQGDSEPNKVLSTHEHMLPFGQTGQLDSDDSAENAAPAKSRKMLKVRPDGKLTSPKAPQLPKAPEASNGIKPRRKRNPAVMDTRPKTLIVTLRYGSDNAALTAIGGNINDNLSGNLTKLNHVKKRIAMSIEPPKATHPFFLGKQSRPQNHNIYVSGLSIKEKAANVDAQPSKPKDVNPKRSRVTSKPADAETGLKENTCMEPHMFRSDPARVTRFPGAKDPLWPPKDMLHIGRGRLNEAGVTHPESFVTRSVDRKLKGAETKIASEEEVLRPLLDLVRSFRNDRAVSQRATSRNMREFRRPLRRLMDGPALQQAISQQLRGKAHDFNPGVAESMVVDRLIESIPSQLPPHKALQKLYKAIATSLTAFDKFEYGVDEWAHKYAPKSAEEVLQPRREIEVLRDWLKCSMTNAVDDRTSALRESSVSRKLGTKTAKRKRKRTDGLGDFIISSDEEASRMDEINDPEISSPTKPGSTRSVIQNGDCAGSSRNRDRMANAIVISGPHGCGKTAAVYAVAQELDFEVFEINAGSRRSGKDILDKVGDMTRNHLVGHTSTGEPPPIDVGDGELNLIETLKDDIESGRQGTMNPFFKSKAKVTTGKLGRKAKSSQASPEKRTKKSRKSQKQSLILLEEVDVVFEEDKLFWTTILSLVLQSKRPVIMTCTDERMLPLQDLTLYGILRLDSPAVQVATDYLLLIACNEGHLLARDAVKALYEAKGLDLRASIAELNFFCQMAIGDTKGGLEWMLTRAATDQTEHKEFHPTRVVSQGTYQKAMGWLGGELQHATLQVPLNQEVDLLSEVWQCWGIDVSSCEAYNSTGVSATAKITSKLKSLDKLQTYDLATDALSVADLLPACVSRDPKMMTLDTTLPSVTEKSRSNFTEGLNVLSADPLVDHGGITEALVLTLRACTRRLSDRMTRREKMNTLDASAIVRMIAESMHEEPMKRGMRPAKLFAGFEPIARSVPTILGAPRGPYISCFDGPTSVVAEDLAPYIRSIVSFDLRLQEQRRQLRSLMSGPGRDGKKARTTRSSHAALEGGQKSLTRRERWLPNETNFDLVLRSGGSEWQAALQQDMIGISAEPTTTVSSDSKQSSPGETIESQS